MNKTPIAVSVLILAAAAGLGWHGQGQLTAARQEQQQLITRAAGLGITLDPTRIGTTGGDNRLTRGKRGDSSVDIRKIANDALAFAKEMEDMRVAGAEPDADAQKRSIAFMDALTKLNAKQLEALLAEFRDAPDLKDETRNSMMSLTLNNLSSLDPQAVLKLITASPDLFPDRRYGGYAASYALNILARKDPLGAADWLLKTSVNNPELTNDNLKSGLLTGASTKDPALAFQLLDQLNFKNWQQGLSTILSAARTPADREISLTALRNHATTITDEKKRQEMLTSGVSQLCAKAAIDGFEAGSKWIESRNFSPEELKGIADGSLNYSIRAGENSQWIAWVGEKLPADQSPKAIDRLVGQWAQADYKAAGEWLATAPEGATKNAAVKSYAVTVSQYAPESAAQWALTLPAGPERTSTLKTIYNRWPKDDPASAAAATAFAKEHGIR